MADNPAHIRIAFLWDWDIVPEHAIGWKDGLAAALRILMTRHEVAFFAVGTHTDYPHEYFTIRSRVAGDELVNEIRDFKPDVILHWGDMTRPHAKPLAALGIPMAVCFAGGNTAGPNRYCFGHVFVENEEYRAKFLAEEPDLPVTIAFGANTQLFQPLQNAPRTLDAVFPAVFADWKRHGLFLEATRGLRTMCAGFMYPVSERYCWERPMESGVVVMPNVTAEASRMMMVQSKCVLVTSKNVGGSQRTVLEALSCNTPVVVMSDNLKCCEYLRDAGCDDWIVDPEPEKIREKIIRLVPRNTRDSIMGKWDEDTYAKNIEEGLSKLLQAYADVVSGKR